MSNSTPTIKPKMGKDKALDDRGQNIQVFVRCRPLNQAEKNVKAFSIVDIPSHREVVVKEKPNTNLTKSYQFDRVFGPKSQQLDVYRSVVEPLIEQVMMGYNCTVFAYGQTGTGKTFTMEGGERRNEAGVSWDSDPTSGIVPRALAQLLDTLQEQADSVEYSVRVSFLELYNEEIFDLLSAHDDTTKLRLYEDATRKGSVIIQGLQEVQVHNKSQVYSILEKGSDKRKTAETLMNAQSSRSHTVFTVTVHIKEASVMGEEVLRIGKLNLVDLAGSENVGRSGAKDARAREAGNINQSLLTLGRVICCLVERAPHVPYRESKLTRLLQDSLGGRTKTSIIATVSPATINLEETLSTLDYAYRARNITNKPEVNQKLSKREVLKEYGDEMNRLRRDLLNLREKNGVYLAKENYHEMLEKIEQQQKDITTKAQEMGALKQEMDRKEKLFEDVERRMIEKSREIRKAAEKLEIQETMLVKVHDELKTTIREKEEQQHLVNKHMQTESKLGQQARKLVIVNDDFEDDLGKLHDKMKKVQAIGDNNKVTKSEFTNNFESMVTDLCVKVDKWGRDHETSCMQLGDNMREEFGQRRLQLEEIAGKLMELVKWQTEVGEGLEKSAEESNKEGNETNTRFDHIILKSAEKGMTLGKKYKAAIMPELQLIVEKLKSQEAALMHLTTTVGDDLARISNKVNTATGDIVKTVEETDQMVQEHYKKNCNNMEQLTMVNRKMLESHVEMRESLGALLKNYEDHRETVGNLGEKAAGHIMALGDAAKPLKKTVTESGKKVKNDSVDLLADVENEASSVSKKIKGSIEESLEDNDGISKSKTNLQVSSGQFEIEYEEVWIDMEKNVGQVTRERIESLEGKKLQATQQIEEVQKKLNECGQFFEELVVSKTTDNLDNLVNKLSIKNKELVKDVDCDVTELSSAVTGLLESDLGDYKVTGKTPVRMERQYPRYLASTSPHSRILDRYRKTVEAEEAAKLPLDESVDSALSESRASTSNAEEKGQGSADSSITSDWEKENIKDEHVFTQPKPKKRELKRPEVAKRNILGSSPSLI